jgi:lipopolysaccharide export system permease protein
VRIIDRYLGSSFLRSWLGVNLVLTGLLSFLELARQLDDIGKGRYNLTDALYYVGLTLPGRMLDMTPPSALLGSILALGLLVKNQELVALRAGGISVPRIGWAFIKPAVLTLFILLLGAQFIIPKLEQAAWTRRESALSKSGTFLPRGGFWTRDDRRFINLRTDRDSGVQSVDIYEFDARGALCGYTHARETRIAANGSWELRDVLQKVISEQGDSTRTLPRLVLPHLLTPRQATELALPPQTLSLSELSSIITNLQKREENPGRYRLTLWQKLTLPIITAAMIMISLPLVCRPARSASLGWHIMVGAIFGVVFFYLNQILGYTGLILQLSPFWTTLLPALVVLAGGAILTRRIV